ncbi:Six-hairpin glycosidase [Mollisia scopiformis]|uniref:Six-hairpin glycosidase n=1 Tax=Mollisia scopiformis TaxID=149040 RepID=A0A132BBS6_MOLSC|nr:Six-hairpin glycosidase [Mollisia scopiformis]KUJ09723.1 Six-hairpin glycosidase [Mollisia scopiformis]
MCLLNLLLHSFIGLIFIQVARADPSSYQWQDSLTSDAAPDWQKYVRSPPNQIVRPVAVLTNYTQGNVTNPNGLLTGKGATTFTRTNISAGTEKDVLPTIVVDFGQNIVGYLSIKFGGASSFNDTPGLPGIRLAFSETLQYLTNVSDFSRSYNGDTITPGSDQIAVNPYPYTWTDVHGCEYGNQVCDDGLHGFRYVKIYLDSLPADAPYTTSYGTVSIDSMSLNFSAFLGTPNTFTGWFESSDDQLNQWWYDGVYTTDMCTDTFGANDSDPRGAASPSLLGKLVILDGAKRDRDPYVGDLAVSARTSYLSHNLPQAARNVLADLADHQRADGWIPPASINNYTLPLLDYPLWWVVCSYDLLMYTGDVAYIQQYYSNIVQVLDTFYPSVTNTQTQLISKGIGISGGYGDYAFLPRSGPVTYYNALYVLALDNAASIATFLDGKQADAARWTARAQNVSASLNKYNFDITNGAFFDGTCGGEAYCETHAQDGNSLSIVTGVANATRANQVLSYLATHNARPYGNSFYDNDAIGAGFSQRVYAFISYFEIEARFIVGSASSALEEIRRLYGWMANHDPTITQWEGIGADGIPYEGAYTSMAHGWATGIVPALTNYILGVIPQGPGFSVYSVKPIPGDVKWAKGVVPTPHGPITVSWNSNPSQGQFYISTTGPAGTKGTVYVPVANASVAVYLDSNPVPQMNGTQSSASQDVGYVAVPINDDQTHVITVGFQMN